MSKIEITKEQLDAALEKTGGNREKTAKLLGIGTRTLYRKLKQLRPDLSRQDSARYEKALAQAKGNKKKAAKLLQISEAQLRKDLDNIEIKGFYKQVKKSKTYVITSAQNATPADQSFLASLMQYIKFNDAELVIIPLRYKNPTSLWSSSAQNADHWDEKLSPYLCDSRFDINENLVVMADIKTQPTAVNPLSGFESISREKSAIFGHTKVELTTVPVVTGNYPKLITTTGAITKPNYTETKTGKKGEFHHTLGATVVEVENDHIFHLRQINATRDGSFIDLNYEYTPTEVYYADPAAALVLGDLHFPHHDRKVIAATFADEESIVNLLNPETLVWHDALDFFSRNHHHEKDPFINIAKQRGEFDNVANEVKEAFKFVEKLAGGRLSVFPYSNHPDAFFRWIKNTDWKLDPVNAEFYLETALEMVRSTKMNGAKSHTVDPFGYWGKRLVENPENFKFLTTDESYDIKGIKVDMHGHLGANGARGGSVRAFAKLGVKSITGHSHGPGICEGAHRVGTSSNYRLDYNKGPSGWLHTHSVIYANGKRSLINIIDGKWKNN